MYSNERVIMFLFALVLLAVSTINCSEDGLTKQQLQYIGKQEKEASFAKKFEQAKSKSCLNVFFEDWSHVQTSQFTTRYDYVRCLSTMRNVYPEEHDKSSDTELLLSKHDTPESVEYCTRWQFPIGCRRNKQTGVGVCYKVEPGEDIQFPGSGQHSPKTTYLPAKYFNSMAILYALQRDAGVDQGNSGVFGIFTKK